MSWVCPMCGLMNDEQQNVCICGHQAEASSVARFEESESSDVFRQIEEIQKETPGETATRSRLKVRSKEEAPAVRNVQKGRADGTEEEVVKEIDSWQFTYSGSDGCMYLGTPALKSFRLRLTLDDLEELMEFMLRKSGVEKTMRKVELSTDDIMEFIYAVEAMIEEKKSKIQLKFEKSELQEVVDIINEKLKE